ncbi:MAG TPA: TIGR02996 domain-containing protein [Gemmataceae bacterium]|nr:TIGR02996 domain-containing protein [Gemmataceae bacterium]
MDEEAGFIAALLASPDDQLVLLAYADWLDERGDPRGQYARLQASPSSGLRELARLARSLDPRWVRILDTRRFTVGMRVWIEEDSVFAGLEGVIREIAPDRSTVTVVVTIFGRPVPIELELRQIELVGG